MHCIRDQTIQTVRFEILVGIIRCIPGVSATYRRYFASSLHHLLNHGHKLVVIVLIGGDRCGNNNLRFVIHCRLKVVGRKEGLLAFHRAGILIGEVDPFVTGVLKLVICRNEALNLPLQVGILRKLFRNQVGCTGTKYSILFFIGLHRFPEELFDAASQLFRGQRLLRGSVCFDLGTVKGNMVQAHEVKFLTDLDDLFKNGNQFLKETAPETADGSVGRLLHRSKIHECGIGVQVALDLPAAEDTQKGCIKEDFHKHPGIVGVLTDGGAVRVVEPAEIQPVDNSTDYTCLVTCRNEFIKGEGEQHGLPLIIGFEAIDPDHKNTVISFFEDFLLI